MYSLHIHTPMELEKWQGVGGQWTCFGVRVPITLDYPTTNLNPSYSPAYDHNACQSQTDRQMDRHTNIMAISNASRAKNGKQK